MRIFLFLTALCLGIFPLYPQENNEYNAENMDSTLNSIYLLIENGKGEEALQRLDEVHHWFDIEFVESARMYALRTLGRYEEWLGHFLPQWMYMLSSDEYNDSTDVFFKNIEGICPDCSYDDDLQLIAHVSPESLENFFVRHTAKLAPDSLLYGKKNVMFHLANGWNENGCYTKALEWSDRIVELPHPRNVDSSYCPQLCKMHILQDKGEYTKVLDIFENLPDSAKMNDAVIHTVALAKARQNSVSDGLEFLRSRMDDDPFQMLSQLFVQFSILEGKFEEAEQMIDSLLNDSEALVYSTIWNNSDETFPEGNMYKGIIYCLRGDKKTAKECFEGYINGDDIYMKSLAEAWLGNKKDVIRVIDKEGSMLPKLNLAVLYNLIGQEDMALQALTAAFKSGSIHPDFLKTDINLRNLLHHPGFGQAASHYQRDACKRTAAFSLLTQDLDPIS